jgi:hypothetical protein
MEIEIKHQSLLTVNTILLLFIMFNIINQSNKINFNNFKIFTRREEIILSKTSIEYICIVSI